MKINLKILGIEFFRGKAHAEERAGERFGSEALLDALRKAMKRNDYTVIRKSTRPHERGRRVCVTVVRGIAVVFVRDGKDIVTVWEAKGPDLLKLYRDGWESGRKIRLPHGEVLGCPV